MPTKKAPIDHIAEAKRYLQNARDILREKGGKDDGFYSDPKYVRMAGNTAYGGVLVALDAIVPKPPKGRKSEEHYRQGIASNQKMVKLFGAVYNHLHLLMGYDGDLTATTAQTGLKLANEIIDMVAVRLPKP